METFTKGDVLYLLDVSDATEVCGGYELIESHPVDWLKKNPASLKIINDVALSLNIEIMLANGASCSDIERTLTDMMSYAIEDEMKKRSDKTVSE